MAIGITSSSRAKRTENGSLSLDAALALAHGLEVVFDRIKEMQHGEAF